MNTILIYPQVKKHKISLLYILIVTFLFATNLHTTFCQSILDRKVDSLQKKLSNESDNIKRIHIINDISRQNLILNNFDKAEEYAADALRLSIQINSRKAIVKSKLNLAGAYLAKNNLDTIIAFAKECIAEYTALNDKENLANSYLLLANFYYKISDFSQSVNYSIQALKSAEQVDAKSTMARACNYLGLAYNNSEDTSNSNLYFLRALKIYTELDEQLGLGNVYNNLGLLNFKRGKFHEAIEYYYKAKDIYIAQNIPLWYTDADMNIGLVFTEQGKNEEALRLFSNSIKVYEGLNASDRIAKAYSYSGVIFHNLGNFSRAKNLLNKSIKLCKEVKDNYTLSTNYLYMYIIDSTLNNYKGALENLNLYTNTIDEILNEENTKKITQAHLSYEFERAEDSIKAANDKEIAIRDATLDANRKEKWFYIIGLVLFATLGVLLFRQGKIRKESNTKLQLLNEELAIANNTKTRFFSILNHDLRSPVSNLIHFLHLKKDSEMQLEEDVKLRLEEKTIHNAERLLASMEDLLLWSKGQMEHFEPRMEHINVEQIFYDNELFFSDVENIYFEYHDPEKLSIWTDENYIKTIIRNLTANSIKALKNTNMPQIIWRATKEFKNVILQISDNGPGASADQFKALYDDTAMVGIKSGLGLHLIRDLAKSIDCSITVDHEVKNGVTIKIMIPITN